MTREWLDAQLGRMVPLRNMPGDSGAYWEALAGASDDFVSAGIARAIRTRTFFPTPAELVLDCEQAAPRETWTAPVFEPSAEATTAHIPNPFGGKGITVTIDRAWKHYCERCVDTGWAEAPGPMAGYTYVARCGCWSGNPALHRKRDAMAQAAASRTAGKGREH